MHKTPAVSISYWNIKGILKYRNIKYQFVIFLMFCIYRLNFNGLKPAAFKRLPYNINFIGFKGNRLETWGTDRFSFSLSCTAVKGPYARRSRDVCWFISQVIKASWRSSCTLGVTLGAGETWRNGKCGMLLFLPLRNLSPSPKVGPTLIILVWVLQRNSPTRCMCVYMYVCVCISLSLPISLLRDLC